MKNAKLLTGWVASAAGLGLAAAFLSGCACCNPSSKAAPSEPLPSGFLYRTNYHGWADSIWVSNGKVEAIIVPAVGRVMQFRFAGEEDGPFWEDPDLAGLAPAEPDEQQGREWRNTGGDRVWPSPQTGWRAVMATNWPPPAAFDGSSVEAQIDGWVVTLVYPNDPEFGVKVTRRIELVAGAPSMEVLTHYEKIDRDTLDLGIWVLTQLKEPLSLHARLPVLSDFPQGFQPMSGRLPPSQVFEIRDRLLALGRDPENSHRIGLEVGSVLWMDDTTVLKIDSPRLPYRNYPENGVSTIVSTEADPQAFVQVEMLSPVKQVRKGDLLKQRSTYTLLRRSELDRQLEATRLLRP